MSGPELPQPIYPGGTPNPGQPGQNPPAGQPAPGQPSPGQPTAPPPGGYQPPAGYQAPAGYQPQPGYQPPSGYAPPTGYGPPPAPSSGPNVKLIGIGVTVLLLVVVVVAVVVSSSGGGGVSDEDFDRARSIARLENPVASSSALDCMAERIARNDKLLDELEALGAADTELTDAGLARAYADMMTDCNSPQELSEYMGSVFASTGEVTVDQAQCIEDAMVDGWDEGDWHEFVELVVQPSRVAEAQAMLVPLTAGC